MQYPSGETMRVGDRVELWRGVVGVVVCSLDTHEFDDEYPEEEWGYLKDGVLVLSDATGLVHCQEAEATFRLLGRQGDDRGKA